MCRPFAWGGRAHNLPPPPAPAKKDEKRGKRGTLRSLMCLLLPLDLAVWCLHMAQVAGHSPTLNQIVVFPNKTSCRIEPVADAGLSLMLPEITGNARSLRHSLENLFLRCRMRRFEGTTRAVAPAVQPWSCCQRHPHDQWWRKRYA